MKYLIIILLLILSSCEYNYKIKYADNSKEVIHSDSPNYHVGDTINVYISYYTDKTVITGKYTGEHRSTKAVIIPISE